jgi:hypothetical protein
LHYISLEPELAEVGQRVSARKQAASAKLTLRPIGHRVSPDIDSIGNAAAEDERVKKAAASRHGHSVATLPDAPRP